MSVRLVSDGPVFDVYAATLSVSLLPLSMPYCFCAGLRYCLRSMHAVKVTWFVGAGFGGNGTQRAMRRTFGEPPAASLAAREGRYNSLASVFWYRGTSLDHHVAYSCRLIALPSSSASGAGYGERYTGSPRTLRGGSSLPRIGMYLQVTETIMHYLACCNI